MGNDRNRRTRDLTQAEAELWAEAMRGTAALRRRRRAAAMAKANGADLPSQAALEAEIERERAQAARQPAGTPLIAVRAAAAPSAGRPAAAPPATLDRRQTRMVATGRAEIDARLDLHGMRQDEAYRALRNFVAAAQARRERLVLVITGKGKAGADAGGEREVGVLRRLVPMWLREPELRGAVIAYGAADIRHGGAGALYVQLRKLR